jgi:endonuclease YncB( thermonuclease family)
MTPPIAASAPIRSFCDAIAVVLVALAVLSAAPMAHSEAATVIVAPVSKVQDGDTFTLKGYSRRIRVWGLDAPEWNRPGGMAATVRMRGLISGQTLRCVLRDTDRYGRYVAQCRLPDGRDIAAEMIRSGAAREYCWFSKGYYGTC